MIRLINQLNNTNSPSEKVDILKTATPYEREAIILCYDPFFQTNLKSSSPNTIGNADFQQSWVLFKEILTKLSKREITGNKAKTIVNTFLGKCDKDTQLVYDRLLKKDLRCGIGIKVINSAFGDVIEEFSVQLSNKYIDFVKKKKFNEVHSWYASPKLDGIRCIYKNGNFYTRQGKPVYGFEKIGAEIEELLVKYPRITFVDGELYSHDIPFQTIQSCVMARKDVPEEIKDKISFHIFAVGGYEATKEMCDFMEVMDVFIEENCKFLEVVKYYKIANKPEVVADLTRRFEEQGYEGSMLRHSTVAYSWKRDDNLLKHKNFLESDFTIIGVYEGTNDLEGSAGGIVVEGEYNGVLIRSEVGSGFKILPVVPDNRDWFWQNQKEVIGKVVEIKFQGITDEPINGKYSLRFPTYRKLKEDR